jgi:hypothetical protein
LVSASAGLDGASVAVCSRHLAMAERHRSGHDYRIWRLRPGSLLGSEEVATA